MRNCRALFLAAFAGAGVPFAQACDFGIDLDVLSEGTSRADADVRSEPDATIVDDANASDTGPDMVAVTDASDAAVGVSAAVQLSSGQDHVCAVRANGTIVCWGACSAEGRLGDGRVLDSSSLVLVSRIDAAVQVAGGLTHTCAVLQSGAVLCWGANSGGALGDGTTDPARTPVSVQGLTNAIAIAAGNQLSCALLQDETVKCWGANTYGEIGDGSTTKRGTPVAVSGLTNVKNIASRLSHTCALRGNGEVWCWGANGSGQLGDGTTTARSTPVLAIASGAQAVGVGDAHSCAVMNGGAIKCWGQGTHGELGNSVLADAPTPVNVFSITDGVSVRGGSAHTCALRSSGGVSCWGSGAWGQLGTGNATITRTAIPVAVANVTGAAELTAGGEQSCVRFADGRVSCWGSNANGRLGRGTATLSPKPVQTVATNIVAIATGEDGSCVRIADGGVRCWGNNFPTNQLGVAAQDLGASSTPVAVNTVVPLDTLAAGWKHNCGVGPPDAGNDGGAYCWGHNGSSQFGSGTVANPNPVRFGGAATKAVAAVAGSAYTCILKPDGAIVCAGINDFAQLGNGSVTQSANPAGPVLWDAGAPIVQRIAGGLWHVCAVTDVGSVHCWGRNSFGQLGLGFKGTPVRNPAATVVFDSGTPIQLELGAEHSCALLAKGVVCWGNNASGQLGNGTGVDSLLAVDVALPTAPTQIATGSNHTCALLPDGTVRCWGANTFGQLGNDSFMGSNSPVTVVGLDAVNAIAAAGDSTCAVRNDGTAFCWGRNAQGQLGDGTLVTAHAVGAVLGFE